MYTSTKDEVAKKLASLNFEAASRQGNLAQVRDATTDPKPMLELHGSLMARTYFSSDSTQIGKGTSGFTPKNQVESRFGATIRTPDGLTGNLLFRLLPAEMANDPAISLVDPWEVASKLSAGTNAPVQQFDLYQATLDYQSASVNATVHYHDGHADWVGQGDFFGFLPESFDLVNPDRENAKNPFGVEMSFPGLLPGLTLYAGPQLYWGAQPRVLARYFLQPSPLWQFTLLHDEEVGVNADATTNAGLTADRSTSLAAKVQIPLVATVEAGVLMGRYNRVEASSHSYAKDVNGVYSTGNLFTWADALAFKGKVTSQALPYLRVSAQYLYAGPLVDTRAATPREGSQLADSGSGNRQEVQATVQANVGDFSLRTTGLARSPLLIPLSVSLGEPLRNPLKDEFQVWDNRKAIQAEAVLNWDRTGATYFHDWNNADREESPLSASLGGLYNLYLGPTDASSFVDTGVTYAFTAGLPEVYGTWSVLGRIAGRPVPGVRVNLTASAGKLQSIGKDTRLVEFTKGGGQLVLDRFLMEGSYAVDAWGPFDWHRQFNITYPVQWTAGVAWGLAPLSLLTDTNRVGVRVNYREFGANSTTTEINSGLKSRVVAELYAGWSF